MSEWDSRNFSEKIQVNPLNSVFLLYGEDTFLKEDALNQLISKVEGPPDFNRDIFYGDDTDIETILSAIEQVPVMSHQRLVVVKEIQDIPDKKLEKLIPLLKKMTSSTLLILIADKIDKRKKIYKNILDLCTPIEFKKPYENQIPDWVKWLATRYGLDIKISAASFLIERVGKELMDLDSEIRKLSQYLHPKTQVTEADILHITSFSRIDSVFDLTHSIGYKQQYESLKILKSLLEHGQNEVGIVSLIARHLRLLFKFKLGEKEGLNGSKLSQKMGINPYFLKKYGEQAQLWTENQILISLKHLTQMDKSLKSSNLSSSHWLENFLFQMEKI